ncbi:MAG: N-acetylmuramoyl-L-alanine amidase [Propionibacteriaceae bacterium]|nr:N-acetylmuramoyl-L-alanine amidase [Propionibacteriaceae bacterium]
MISRRSLVAAAALLPVVGGALHGAPVGAATPPQPPIRPRSDWAGSLSPKGPLPDEEDVRFLLVHHTLTPNGDAAEKIPERLRSIYRYHTSKEKGWADVAYNFFVDPHGTIWEGREGSLTRPVQGDATGGSQGFALLCCFIGDFTEQPPTEAAMAAMTSLLGWLAGRHGLDLGTQTTFTSRGSNKWRTGAEVTTDRVAAHRDMSATACPGDALYPLVASQLLPDARALLVDPTPTPTPTPAPTPSPAEGEPSADPSGAEAGAGPSDAAVGWARAAGAGALLAGIGGIVATMRHRGSADPP